MMWTSCDGQRKELKAVHNPHLSSVLFTTSAQMVGSLCHCWSKPAISKTSSFNSAATLFQVPNANTKIGAPNTNTNTNILSLIEITKQCIQYHHYQHDSLLYLYVFQLALLHYVTLPFNVLCLKWIFSADMVSCGSMGHSALVQCSFEHLTTVLSRR